MFNQKKSDVGSIPTAAAPSAAAPCPHSPRDAGSRSQRWAREPRSLGNPPVKESLCNSTDRAAFASRDDEEVTGKALSSPGVVLELGVIMRQCLNKLQR